MNWKSIANTVGKIAPTLGSLLGGPAGASVGTLIATTLGVENTPDAVSEALRINPEAAIKLAEIESNQKVKLEELTVSVAIKEFESITQNMSDVNSTMQAEAKSEHALTYSWRPLIGISVAFNVAVSSLIVLTAFFASMAGHPEMLVQLPMILGALAAINTSVLPILGIASYFRGKAQADPSVPFNNKG